MPTPRLHLQPSRLKPSTAHSSTPQASSYLRPSNRRYAAVATATTPAPSQAQILTTSTPIERYPPTQPPSLKPPEFRKTQLHRLYTSLLRSTPLILVFQHNNLLATEWAAIRRELTVALRKTSKQQAKEKPSGDDRAPENHSSAWLGEDPADAVRLQVIQTGVFAQALRIVEFYDPLLAQRQAQAQEGQPLPTQGQSPVQPQRYGGISAVHPTEQINTTLDHALSREAYDATFAPDTRDPASLRGAPDGFNARQATLRRKHLDTPLHTVLHGPLAVLTFPSVTPAHLAAALRILAPTEGRNSAFASPRRKDQPGYYDDNVQNGLKKLLLLAARVEGRTMDLEDVKWVAGVEGGLDGLRAQLVNVLTMGQAQVVRTLEGASNSLWLTMESRRMDMDDKENGNGAKTEA